MKRWIMVRMGGHKLRTRKEGFQTDVEKEPTLSEINALALDIHVSAYLR